MQRGAGSARTTLTDYTKKVSFQILLETSKVTTDWHSRTPGAGFKFQMDGAATEVARQYSFWDNSLRV